MDTWELRATDAHDAAGGFIACIGASDFGANAFARIDDVVAVGAWSAYVLHRDRAPTLIASATRAQPDQSPACWQAYRGDLYRSDRTFDSAWDAAGHRLSRCTQADFGREHRSRIYERIQAHERLSLTRPTDEGHLLAINLYRLDDAPAFDADDVAALARVSGILAACVVRHQGVTQGRAAPQQELHARLRRLHARLTEREVDVLAELVQGRTYLGVSKQLGLSLTTVKTYRERAFLKLGIHFRSELYGLLLRV